MRRATSGAPSRSFENQQARRRAAVGDYAGAAEAQRDAHRDWHAARRQDERARDESGAVIIGR